MRMTHRRINVLALVLLAVAAAATGWAATHAGQGRAAAVVHGSTPARASDPDGHTPVTIDIPSAGVHARVVDLGVTDDGTLQIPATEQGRYAGWYDRSAAPGDTGTSVIVGRDDGRRGRAVFHDLHEVRLADTVDVTRRDGSRVRFTVTQVEHLPRHALVTEVRRAGGDTSTLRLVTCAGDRHDGGRPTGTLVVRATAVHAS
ncbi:sortase domain-bontaining protein [Actinacidiphila glaucinigra]|uniref:sortase domain-containing protein n=1 Tax=Actinacidiphila glaucinigra TaxID=235986 RepID=UPI0037F7A694